MGIGTQQDAGALSGKMTVTGSSTVAPLVAELAVRFEAIHPGVRIDVQTGGSGKGIADARLGVADIGMASRALSDDEADLIAHPIAADGIGIIVHPSNEINELSSDQIRSIYDGTIVNWNQAGGPDLKITVVHKAEGRATLEVFLKHFAINNVDVRADVIVGDNQHGLKTVAGNPGAIGYVSIGSAEAESNSGLPVRLLPVDGVEASSQNVASGRFPIRRPLNLVTSQGVSPLAAAFIDFCQSDAAKEAIQAQFFVPIVGP
ncbi:MAG: phosphate ABC transporter substrate-binding protein [Planctomycetota bacterium]